MYEVYLKKDMGNQIAKILKADVKKIEISGDTIDVNHGCLIIGNYMIPIDNILFLKKVV